MGLYIVFLMLYYPLLLSKLLTLDCETKGLEATPEAFIIGCITHENLKSEIFYKPLDMWNRILEIGAKNAQKGGVLNVYAHNMGNFDWWAFSDKTNKNLRYLSDNPFICNYVDTSTANYKPINKFLDSYSIFKMPLSAIGDIIGQKKMETPQSLIDGNTDNPMVYIPYVTNDSEIVMRGLIYLRNKLKEDGVALKRMYTIHQIAIQYFLNMLKKKERPYFFFNAERNQVHFTRHEKQIHEAYKGGRIECFKTRRNIVTSIDRRSLYPYSAMQIRFPDLRTQEMIYNPLGVYSQSELLNKNGISRCILRNKTCELGLLPIKLPEQSYYPKKGQILIGTWTHRELKLAIKVGYDILGIQWSIYYEDASENPYKEIIPILYAKKENGNEFDKYFYKSVMNNHLGKLAQVRVSQEMLVDNVESTKQYIENGYKAIKGIPGTLDYMFKKENVKVKKKSYYCPIIPALVNAEARCLMYMDYIKIPVDNLVYTDTDSIFFTGNHLKKFRIGNKIGDYKIEHENQEMLLWGRKTYGFGEDIKVSGVHKSDISKANFEEGYLTTRKIIKLKQTEDISNVGKFETVQRDLKKQESLYKENMALLKEQEVLIDYTIPDISYFLPILSSLK